MSNNREKFLETKIDAVKEKLVSLGRLRPGSLSQQYNVCGKIDCCCKALPPKKHGPYYQLSFSHQAKSTTRFIRREHVGSIRKELQTYKQMQKLVAKWIELEIMLSQLRLKTDSK